VSDEKRPKKPWFGPKRIGYRDAPYELAGMAHRGCYHCYYRFDIYVAPPLIRVT